MPLILMNYAMAPDPSWASTWFVCDQVGVWNWERWCDPKFDQLNADALVESDVDKRAAMYIEMQDMMEESGGYVFLTHGVHAFIYNDDLVPAVSVDGSHLHYRDFREV